MFLGINAYTWFIVIQYVFLGIYLLRRIYRDRIRTIVKVEFYAPVGTKEKYKKSNMLLQAGKEFGAVMKALQQKNFSKWSQPMAFAGSVEFEPSNPVAHFNGRSYVINLKYPAVIDSRKTIYAFDLSTHTQMWFGGETSIKASVEGTLLLNLSVGQGALYAIFGVYLPKKKADLIFFGFICVALVCGIFMGIFIAPYVQPQAVANATGGA